MGAICTTLKNLDKKGKGQGAGAPLTLCVCAPEALKAVRIVCDRNKFEWKRESKILYTLSAKNFGLNNFGDNNFCDILSNFGVNFGEIAKYFGENCFSVKIRNFVFQLPEKWYLTEET